MLAPNDIVTWTNPRTGDPYTGVIVSTYGSGRYVVQVWRQFARRPRLYRPNPEWLRKLR